MPSQASIDKLRRYLADTGTPPEFSDSALSALLTEAGDDFDVALAAGLTELQAKAAKLVDYTVGPDNERASQLFDHLTTRLKDVQARIARQQQQIASGSVEPTGTTTISTVAVW